MRPFAFSLSLMAIVSSCSKEPGTSPTSGAAEQAMVIRVAGMQKGEGGKT